MPSRFGVVATAARVGKPDEAVEYREVEADDFDPEDEKAVVKIKTAYAAVHPSDVNVLEGTYLHKIKYYPSAPVGYEGSGYVTALSKGAKALGTLKEGDLVVGKMYVTPALLGKTGGWWATELVGPAEGVIKVPDGISPEQAANIGVNPMTAFWMLKNPRANLKPGMWVIQNLGNSAVGTSVCRLAKKMGLKTCSLVRREDAAAAVKEAGGDVAVVVDFPPVDQSLSVKEYQEKRKGQVESGAAAIKTAMAEIDPKAQFMLAFDGVGGVSAETLIKVLSPGGTSLTYGVMSRDSTSVSGGQLIFKSICLDGFILWNQMPGPTSTRTVAEWDVMMGTLFESAKDSNVAISKIYPLSEVKEAVKHAFSGSRDGKVMLKCNEDIP